METVVRANRACPRCNEGVLVEGTKYLASSRKPGEALARVTVLRCIGADRACGTEWVTTDGAYIPIS